MSGEIKVGFDAISNLATQINSQVQNIDSQLDTLKAAIAKLQQQWTGGASDSFQAVQTQWNNSAEDLKSVLARICTAVGAAHDSYHQTEQSNTAVWS
jgi:ESAT-6 family protein